MKRLFLLAFVYLFNYFGASAQDLYNDSVIVEIRIEFSQPNWRDLLMQNVKDEKDIPCTLFFDGVRYDSVGIRYKGNSSFNVPSEKKPFNITMDAYKQDQNLLGYKTLNLNNGFFDPAFVREKIGYDVARRFLPAVKANYAKLYINNEYWALYLNIQQPNKTFLKENFLSNDGNSYKCDPRGDLTWLGTDTQQYKKSYEKKTNETEADWSDLVGFIEKLNNLPQQTFQTEIYKYLDVDRALWYLAFCNILSSLDSYIGSGHNFYFYNHPVDIRFNTIPWDLNEVLGTFQMQMTIPQLESLGIYFGDQDQRRPLTRRLLSVAEWKKRYIAHYRTMLEEVMNESYWRKRVQFFQGLIRTSLEADTRKLYNMTQFDQNVNSNTQVQMGPGQRLIPGILSFVNNRENYLWSLGEFQSDLPVATGYELTPQNPKSEDDVKVKANTTNTRDLNLWYSINNQPFQKIIMKSVQGEPGAYDATIPKQLPGTYIRFYFEAISNQTVYAYNPSHAEHQFFTYTVQPVSGNSAVVINEVMAANKTAIADPQGGFADWVELYNTSAVAVDLGGKYLSDDINEPKKWRFPTGVSISGNGYLLIWCDGDTLDTPGLHASFKLSRDGEGAFLYDSDLNGNKLLDSVTFGAQLDDVSWGRYPNGTGAFRFMTYFTPNSKNMLGPEPLVASFSAEPIIGRNPLEVNFADSSTGGPTSYFWQFGDGGTSLEQNPVHTYTEEGIYSVKLKIKKNNDSNEVEKTDYIIVKPKLLASFTAEPQSGITPLSVQFTDNSTGEPSGWYWTFGDDSSSTEQNPVHIYETSGTFTVTLTVSDGNYNDTKTVTDYIIVNKNTGVDDADDFNLMIFNYPNPFNNETRISFRLTRPQKITLKVFDILGCEVKTLVNGEFDTGENVVIFDGSNLLNGIYYYILKTENEIIRKLMVKCK
ncbi:MAG: PKD domain-containing protein [Bacteroidetes bacterium]|nr:MAG: PKD domain-containing protein [Bacteroidota bacterium]